MSRITSGVVPANGAVISPSSPESIGAHIRCWAGGFVGAAASPTANKAFFIPFLIYQPYLVQVMALKNTSTTDNADVGIYDAEKNRIVSKGSTALSTTGMQTFDITDTTLEPGQYYMAVAVNGTTSTLDRWAPTNLTVAGGAGVLMQTSAFALPATANWVAAVDAFVPDVAIFGRTVV